MGLRDGNKTGGNTTYLKTYKGRIVQEWRNDKPKDEWIPEGKELLKRETSEGNVIYYISWKELADVKIESIDMREGKGNFNDELILVLSSDGDTFQLETSLTGSYGSDIIRKFPNIELSEPLTLNAWVMTPEKWKELTGRDTTKDKFGMGIKQDGENLKPAYTTENKLLPELVKKKKGKSFTWDGSDRENFLYEKLEGFITGMREDNKKVNPF